MPIMTIYSINGLWHDATMTVSTGLTVCGLPLTKDTPSRKCGSGEPPDPPLSTLCKTCFAFMYALLPAPDAAYTAKRRPLYIGNMQPLDEHDRECLMPVDEFLAGVSSHYLTPDDGVGFWATEKEYLDVAIQLDTAGAHKPEWATHVCWFNK